MAPSSPPAWLAPWLPLGQWPWQRESDEDSHDDDLGTVDDTRMQLNLPFLTAANAPAPSTAADRPGSAAVAPRPNAIWRPYAAHFPPPRHRVNGEVRVLAGVHSPQLGNQRDLLVHLPPSYHQVARRYPVVYMHDGQNLFDHATSFAGAWNVDDTMLELAHKKRLEAIVVAIPNTSDRMAEYGPFIDPRFGGGRGADYVRFLVDTVKPLVDSSFRTLPARASTGTLGASMGGLISLYAQFARPDVFGFAGALSPSLFFGREAIYPLIAQRGPVPGRIYVDIGAKEGFRRFWSNASRGVLPSDSVRRARRLAWLLERLGYRRGKDLLFVEDKRGRHDERAWSRRLPRALRFLLSGTGAKAPR